MFINYNITYYYKYYVYACKKNISIDDNFNYEDLGFLLSLIVPLSHLYVHMGSERVLNNIINNTFFIYFCDILNKL